MFKLNLLKTTVLNSSYLYKTKGKLILEKGFQSKECSYVKIL